MKRKYNKYSIKSVRKPCTTKVRQPKLEFTPANIPLSGEGDGSLLQKVNLQRDGSQMVKLQGVAPKTTESMTPKEAEVLRLFLDMRNTPEEITVALKCSKSLTYRRLRKLIKKGWLDGSLFPERVLSDPSPLKTYVDLNTPQIIIQKKFENNQEQLKNNCRGIRDWRFHGIQLHITFSVLDRTNKYAKKLGTHKYIFEGTEHKITAYPRSLEVYIKGEGWHGLFPDEAVAKAQSYIRALLERIQWDYGVHFIKARQDNIRVSKAHISEVRNEIAVEYLKEGRKLKIVSDVDGKVWADIDYSLQSPEVDFNHPTKQVQDANHFHNYWNDIRNHPNIMMPSHLQGMFQAIMEKLNAPAPDYKKTIPDKTEQMFG